jgi:hypothetical protein
MALIKNNLKIADTLYIIMYINIKIHIDKHIYIYIKVIYEERMALMKEENDLEISEWIYIHIDIYVYVYIYT